MLRRRCPIWRSGDYYRFVGVSRAFRLLFFVIVIYSFSTLLLRLSAQEVDEGEWLSACVHRLDPEGENSEYWESILFRLLQSPKDINRVTADELKEIPMLSEFQIVQFIQFRHRLNGAFQTIYDLKMIPSWDIELVRLVAPLFTIRPPDFPEQPHYSAPIRGSFYTHLSRVPTTKKEGYLGSSETTKTALFLESRDAWALGCLYHKSAYESYFVGHDVTKPSFLSFFYKQSLSFPRKQTIYLGDFALQMGAGLVMNLSSRRNTSLGVSESWVHNRLRGNRSAGRSAFVRGIALEGDLFHGVSYQFFVSSTPIDAVVDEHSRRLRQVVINPLRRSSRDEDKYHRARIYALGGNLYRAGENGLLGITYCTYTAGRYDMDYLPRYALLEKSSQPIERYANGSVYYDYLHPSGRWNLSGELACDWGGAWAWIHSMAYRTSQDDWGVELRYLQKDYKSLYGQSYTHRATLGNELGFRCRWERYFSNGWQAQLLYDRYRSADKPYREDGSQWLLAGGYNRPKTSFRLEAKYLKNASKPSQARVRLWLEHLWKNYKIRWESSYKQIVQSDSYGYLVGINASRQWTISERLGRVSCRLSTSYYRATDYLTAMYPYLRVPLGGSYFKAFWGEGVLWGAFVDYHFGRWNCQMAYHQKMDTDRYKKRYGSPDFFIGISLQYRWRSF